MRDPKLQAWPTLLSQLLQSLLLLFVMFSWVGIIGSPAEAVMFQQQEAPGQILTQSRSSLRDINGRSWQVICFRRQRPDGGQVLLVRLVGFPGMQDVSHPHDLEVKTALGEVWYAPDRVDLIGPAQERPGNVGQYDLEAVLDYLKPEIPTRLGVTLVSSNPTDNPTEIETIELRLTPGILREWQQVADSD